jgi:serine/threonine protein kinase
MKHCTRQLNVLIDEKGQACLVDFGLSSMVKMGEKFEYLRPHEKQHGAFSWTAPELINFDGDGDGDGDVANSLNHKEVTKRYMPSPSSDMYSYGCIMFEVSLLGVQKTDCSDGNNRFFPVKFLR